MRSLLEDAEDRKWALLWVFDITLLLTCVAWGVPPKDVLGPTFLINGCALLGYCIRAVHDHVPLT